MNLLGFNITRNNVTEAFTEVVPPVVEKISDNVTVVNGFDFASDNKYLPSDYSTLYTSGGYMRYGADNLFPDKLVELYNSSPLHKAAVDFKVRLLFGEGYGFKSDREKIKSQVFADNIGGNIDLTTLIQQCIVDYKSLGNFYLLFTFNEDFSRIAKVERLKAFGVRLRVNLDGAVTGVVYNNNWKFKPGTHTDYAIFDVNNKKDKKQVYIGCMDSIDNNPYIFPDYVSGLNSIAANAAIGLYQLNIVENGFSPSMSIQFFKKPSSPEEKNKIVNGIKSQYSGKKNAGKALIFFSDGKDLAPEVKPIEVSNLDKQFTVLEQSIENNIVYAHGIISPTLLGIKTAGQLGNTAELKNAFIISNKMKVDLERGVVERAINKAFKYNNLDEILLKSIEIFVEEITAQ